jgi:hypothetical protein
MEIAHGRDEGDGGEACTTLEVSVSSREETWLRVLPPTTGIRAVPNLGHLEGSHDQASLTSPRQTSPSRHLQLHHFCHQLVSAASCFPYDDQVVVAGRNLVPLQE